ncbi:hypothetical protein KAH55_12740, partial [bacterium]|nr:hypothetical protein [bacterium]
MSWLLLLLLGLIIGFIYWMTHQPSFTMPGARLPGFRAEQVPWGVQRFGVGTEALQPFERDADSIKLFEEMLVHMGWTPREQYFLNAVLFGLDIALTTDDYSRAGIEFEDAAQVAGRLKKIEFELFDN